MVASTQRPRTDHSVRNRLNSLARATATPLSALLELTKRCNLRCYHCYVAGVKEEMPSARWLGLIRELADRGCLKVSLSGGEVGLRGDFLAIAEGVKRQRMALSVLTNGTLFEPADIDALAGLKPALVSVSLYGASAYVHEHVTGVAGSFTRSVETLRRLRERGVRCRVATVLMNDTLGEYPLLAEMAESLGCEFTFDPTVGPRADGDVSPLAHRVPSDRLTGFYRDYVVPAVAAVKTFDARPTGGVTTSCGAGFTGLYIDAAGEVLPCVGLGPSFGNVANHSFAEAWHGSAATDHRERMSRSRAECSACELLPFCTSHCPRLAAAEDGDAAGRSTRACELALLVRDLGRAVQAKTPPLELAPVKRTSKKRLSREVTPNDQGL